MITSACTVLIVLFEAYFFLRACAKALAAADFDAALVLLSLSVLLAAVAAFFEVCFAGAFRCPRALPADDLDLLPVDFDVKVLDAALPAFFPVIFVFFAMSFSLLGRGFSRIF
jgi:hypothetical protein